MERFTYTFMHLDPTTFVIFVIASLIGIISYTICFTRRSGANVWLMGITCLAIGTVMAIAVIAAFNAHTAMVYYYDNVISLEASSQTSK